MQSIRFRVNISINNISAEHVPGVWIRVSKEIRECDSREGIVIIELTLVEFHLDMVNNGAVMMKVAKVSAVDDSFCLRSTEMPFGVSRLMSHG